jgi:hypothetical protein
MPGKDESLGERRGGIIFIRLAHLERELDHRQGFLSCCMRHS